MKCFAHSHSVRQLQGWGSHLHCLAPDSIFFTLAIAKKERMKESVALGERVFSALPLSAEAVEREAMSTKSQEMWKAQEMRGALFSASSLVGEAVGVDPGVLVVLGNLTVAHQTASPRGKGLGDGRAYFMVSVACLMLLPEGKTGPCGVLTGRWAPPSSAAGRLEGEP